MNFQNSTLINKIFIIYHIFINDYYRKKIIKKNPKQIALYRRLNFLWFFKNVFVIFAVCEIKYINH